MLIDVFFQAPYLPWVLLIFSVLLGNTVIVDFLGMGVGHLYFYLEDVFPNLQGGFRILRTPNFLYVIFTINIFFIITLFHLKLLQKRNL